MALDKERQELLDRLQDAKDANEWLRGSIKKLRALLRAIYDSGEPLDPEEGLCLWCHRLAELPPGHAKDCLWLELEDAFGTPPPPSKETQ